MVKFIEQYTPLKQSDLVGAALHGSIEIVQYYLDKGFNVDDAKLCTTAAYPNHREFLKFVIKRGAPFSIAVMRFAASRNYVDLLQEMQAKGCKPKKRFKVTRVMPYLCYFLRRLGNFCCE